MLAKWPRYTPSQMLNLNPGSSRTNCVHSLCTGACQLTTSKNDWSQGALPFLLKQELLAEDKGGAGDCLYLTAQAIVEAAAHQLYTIEQLRALTGQTVMGERGEAHHMAAILHEHQICLLVLSVDKAKTKAYRQHL